MYKVHNTMEPKFDLSDNMPQGRPCPMVIQEKGTWENGAWIQSMHIYILYSYLWEPSYIKTKAAGKLPLCINITS